MKKLIGHIGVDSGNIFIVDPCYIKNHPELFDDEKWGDFVKARHPVGKTIQAMPLFSGVVSHTNYGDGEYPVYVTFDEDGQPTKLEIDFVGDDEE
jgi:major membrane immunogen (membrane-anchored lipoprotein)